MRELTDAERDMLQKHLAWLRNEDGGIRACLGKSCGAWQGKMLPAWVRSERKWAWNGR